MTPYHGSLVAAVALVALALASTTTRRASSPIARRSDPRRQTPHDRPSQAFWDHRPRARPRPAVLGHRAFAWRCFVYANGDSAPGHGPRSIRCARGLIGPGNIDIGCGE